MKAYGNVDEATVGSTNPGPSASGRCLINPLRKVQHMN
jgi:hypothetical protein